MAKNMMDMANMMPDQQDMMMKKKQMLKTRIMKKKIAKKKVKK